MNRNEWIENIDANENEKQRRVVMRVMEMKEDAKEVRMMNRRVCLMKWVKMSFEEMAKSTMVKWMIGKVKNARMMEWKEDGMRMMWDE